MRWANILGGQTNDHKSEKKGIDFAFFQMRFKHEVRMRRLSYNRCCKQWILLLLLFVGLLIVIWLWRSSSSLTPLNSLPIDFNNTNSRPVPIIHFVWTNADRSDLPMIVYLSIKAAAIFNLNSMIYFHYLSLPQGLLFTKTQPFVTHFQSFDSHLQTLFGRNGVYKDVSHAQKSDYCRLYLLREYGGIYIDSDILLVASIESFFPLIESSISPPQKLFIPIEHTDKTPLAALCNAFLVSSARNPILSIWMKKLLSLPIEEWKKSNTYYAVIYPLTLYSEYPQHFFLIPTGMIYTPSWDRLDDLFHPTNRRQIDANIYGYHLWQQAIRIEQKYVRLIADYSEAIQSRTLYGEIVRKIENYTFSG